MKILLYLAVIAGSLAFIWHAGGYHIVHKRPDWQYFGCKDTYINDKGEDTGECQ
jgi:hypothetical protein